MPQHETHNTKREGAVSYCQDCGAVDTNPEIQWFCPCSGKTSRCGSHGIKGIHQTVRCDLKLYHYGLHRNGVSLWSDPATTTLYKQRKCKVAGCVLPKNHARVSLDRIHAEGTYTGVGLSFYRIRQRNSPVDLTTTPIVPILQAMGNKFLQDMAAAEPDSIDASTVDFKRIEVLEMCGNLRTYINASDKDFAISERALLHDVLSKLQKAL